MKSLRIAPAARVAALVSSVVLAGCGGSDPSFNTQVAARINSGEISVHQVQAALARQPRLVTVAAERAPRVALDNLVEQEIAAQAAKSEKLDADPVVIQQLEAARREVLARAYHERVSGQVSIPSSDEIDRYFDSRPELFAERRLYMLQETVVELEGDKLARLQAAVAAAASPDDLARALREAGGRHLQRQTSQAAEDLPMHAVKPLSELAVGRSLWLPQEHGGRILTVLGAAKAPIDRRAAADAISSYLVAERKRERIGAAMKSLRESARVEYVGKFASNDATLQAR